MTRARDTPGFWAVAKRFCHLLSQIEQVARYAFRTWLSVGKRDREERGATLLSITQYDFMAWAYMLGDMTAVVR
jgi:hypothetical protein